MYINLVFCKNMFTNIQSAMREYSLSCIWIDLLGQLKESKTIGSRVTTRAFSFGIKDSKE